MLTCLLAARLPSVWAASPGQDLRLPPRTFLNQPVIVLPINLDPASSESIRDVILYVKNDPARQWMPTQRARKGQTEFRYEAPADGEYWFMVVTVDHQGRRSSKNLATEQPQAIAVVDRIAPRIQLQSFPSPDNGCCIRCIVEDEHPQASSIRFQYQSQDHKWVQLEPTNGAEDLFCIPGSANATGMIRVAAKDQCGNFSEREIHVLDCKVSQTELVTNKMPPTPPIIQPTKSEHPAGKKHNEVVHAHFIPKSETESRSVREPNNLDLPLVPVVDEIAPAPAPPALANHRVEFVNKRHVFLKYQLENVGKSGVGKVAVWLTTDLGKSWQFGGEDRDKRNVAELDLPGEGVFGVTMVASNGRGFGGVPPAPGELPDRLIEVDVTAPRVQLVSVTPMAGDEAGKMLIRWIAHDKNLIERPIELQYSAAAKGPWKTICKDLANTGSYQWHVPHEAGGKVYVKISATDKAGNRGEHQTEQPTQIDDLSRPQVRVIDVLTSAPKH